MKKYIAILFLMLMVFVSYSTDRTLPSSGTKLLQADDTKSNSITWSYTGVAADTITSNQDSIVYNVTLNKSWPANYYIKVGLDTIAGADTVKININGRMFDDESWSLIETTTSSAIPSATDVTIESITDADYYLTAAAHNITEAAYNGVLTMDTTATWPNPASSTTIDSVLYKGTIVNASHVLAVASHTLTPTVSIKPSYRQIQVEVIRIGSGSGVTIEDIEWYFQKAEQ